MGISRTEAVFPVLELDTEMIERWSLISQFLIGAPPQRETHEIMERADRHEYQDGIVAFINQPAGFTFQFTDPRLVGTQAEVLGSAAQRYVDILGPLATQAGLSSARMKVENNDPTNPRPYGTHLIATPATGNVSNKLEVVMNTMPEALTMDVSQHLRRMLRELGQ